jgi:putative transposase
MLIEKKTKLIFNLKRIIRVKKKFELETKIRKPSRIKASVKLNEEHKTLPNLLNRNFNPKEDEILISTDITELPFLGGQKAYLSVFKDLKSKKIIHYNLKQRSTIELVMMDLNQVFKRISEGNRSKMIIHSDQGYHYTSYAYRSALSSYGITQSMSRKGNCLDNAPIESFFGHLKDEAEYRTCRDFKELKREIKRYIKYYNDERPQWELKRKTPAEAEVNKYLVF